MNKYIQQSESVEQIIAAAIRLKGGRIYQSHSHSRCMFDAIANGEKGPVDCEQGFVTNEGRFVSRTEAMTIAYKAKQTHRSEGELFSEDVTYPQMKSPPHKEHGEWEDEAICELGKEPDGHALRAKTTDEVIDILRPIMNKLLLSTQQEAGKGILKYLKQYLKDQSRQSPVTMYNQGYYQAIKDVENYLKLTPKETI